MLNAKRATKGRCASFTGWGARAAIGFLSVMLIACGGGGEGAGTPAPSTLRVTAASVADGDADVDTLPSILVSFDSAVGSGVGATDVQLTQGAVAIPVTVEIAASSLVIIKPIAPLQLRSNYRLTIKAGATASNGAILQSDYVVNFRTMTLAMATRTLSTLPVEFVGSKVGAGDLNGDGRVDLILQAYDVHSTFDPTYTLSIYIQNSDGSVTLQQTLQHKAGFAPVATDFGKPIVMDVDGDGSPEVLISHDYFGEESLTGLQIFKRGSDGRFRAESFRQTRYCRKVVAVDVDGDGRLDLLCSIPHETMVSRSGFQVFLNKSAGLIALPPVDIPEGYAARELVAGDLNGDGIPEILMRANAVLPAALWVYEVTAGGSSLVRNTALGQAFDGLCLDLAYCGQMALVDVDADGWLDLVFANSGPGPFAAAYMRLPGAGFTAGFRVSLGGGQTMLHVTDIDSDGVMDMYVFNNTDFNYVGAAFGQRRGTFEYSRVYGLPPVTHSLSEVVVVTDFDGDGRPDVVVVWFNELTLMQQTL